MSDNCNVIGLCYTIKIKTTYFYPRFVKISCLFLSCEYESEVLLAFVTLTNSNQCEILKFEGEVETFIEFTREAYR